MELIITITCIDHHALVTAHLVGADRRAEVRALLDRFGVQPRAVVVDGESYEITDLGMRMLEPRELFRAQGFPDSYVIAPPFNGKPMTKTSQVRMCGNSVSPHMSRALAGANFQHLDAVAA